MKLLFLIASLILAFHAHAQNLSFDSTMIWKRTIIYFDNDAYELDKEDHAKIISLSHLLEDLESYVITITAHTDEKGTEAYNMDLSKRRMQSIYDAVKLRGISNSIINTDYKGEQFPAVIGHDERAYKQNRRGVIDVETAHRFLKLEGIVYNESNEVVGGVDIAWQAEEFSGNTTSRADGRFEVVVPLEKMLHISFNVPGLFYRRIEADPRKLGRRPWNVKMPEIIPGRKFHPRHLNFRGNSSCLIPQARYELYDIVKTLQYNPKVCLELAGHINGPNRPNCPVQSSHHQLSIARALAMKDTLISRGIAENRLLAKGYGNHEMLFPHTDDDEEMQLNRRVELIIRPCDSIATATDDALEWTTNFYDDPLNVYFTTEKLRYDLSRLTPQEKNIILRKLRKFKAEGVDPTHLTYRELLMK